MGENTVHGSTATKDGANVESKNTSVGCSETGVKDHAKVRGVLKYLVRGKKGRGEQCQTLGVVFDGLERFKKDVDGGQEKRVLVPGAGCIYQFYLPRESKIGLSQKFCRKCDSQNFLRERGSRAHHYFQRLGFSFRSLVSNSSMVSLASLGASGAIVLETT